VNYEYYVLTGLKIEKWSLCLGTFEIEIEKTLFLNLIKMQKRPLPPFQNRADWAIDQFWQLEDMNFQDIYPYQDDENSVYWIKYTRFQRQPFRLFRVNALASTDELVKVWSAWIPDFLNENYFEQWVDHITIKSEIVSILVTSDWQTLFTLPLSPIRPQDSKIFVNWIKYTYGVDYTINWVNLTWFNVTISLEIDDGIEFYIF